MALITMRELKSLIHPHYIINIILAFSYIFLKNVYPFCAYLFSSCEFDYRETEILFFTAVIIVFRTRKHGAINLMPYLSSGCMFLKMGNVLLYFYSDPVYGILYIAFCLLHLLLIPEPSYHGPENILYIRGTDLEEELQKNSKIVWVVELYAAWSPPCIEFAGVFSQLSHKYSLENLRFAKVDLSRNTETARKYKINTSPLSKQMPTLLLFKNGREYMRRPMVNNNSKLIPFLFTYENVVDEFELNSVSDECKKNPLKNKRQKED